jgi:hypothetical protein
VAARPRISFAKVAEYQKRGAVHFHAIIRLDAATDWAHVAEMELPGLGLSEDREAWLAASAAARAREERRVAREELRSTTAAA